MERLTADNDKLTTADSSDIPDLPLISHPPPLSLDRLVPGVDNVRRDVHLSPRLCRLAAEAVTRLLARLAECEKFMDQQGSGGWIEAVSEFRAGCVAVMTEGLGQAKLIDEPQIDLLVQIAIARMMTSEIRRRYRALVKGLQHKLTEWENSHYPYEKAIQDLKDRLTYLRRNRSGILERASVELFTLLVEVQNQALKEMRRTSLGKKALGYEELFRNPMITASNPEDDLFLYRDYIPVKGLPDGTMGYRQLAGHLAGKPQAHVDGDGSSSDQRLLLAGNWLKRFENIDLLFNYFQSRASLGVLKKQKSCHPRDKKQFKAEARQRKERFDRLFRDLKKKGLVGRITAFYEMQPLLSEFCPPLTPPQLLDYLTRPAARREIALLLKKQEEFYGKTYSVGQLKKTIRSIARTRDRERRFLVIRFLKRFSRYHCDHDNYRMFQQLMDNVHLVRDAKTLKLSRANNTLYTFTFPDEHNAAATEVRHHTIIKADVRSSTEIVNQMKKKGLNPASYFSLNFFNPITELISEFDAEKIFIEGDAVILAISEKPHASASLYGVARACGLAIRMLSIVKRYNRTTRKHRLPVLELGIGISFLDDAPTFLFDGEDRIMISPAIHSADRMAGCAKPLRKSRSMTAGPFNLYVFQTVSDAQVEASQDDLFLRYNVNGIELNRPGFKKLQQEINLQQQEYDHPGTGGGAFSIHTGVYPTGSGSYQRLIVREAPIPRLDLATMTVTGLSSRSYYEICTSKSIYEMVRKRASGKG